MSKLIALDFDGVIHSYTSKWTGDSVISDPPVDGALEFIESCMMNGLRICIFSTRNASPVAIVAMKSWLGQNGLRLDLIDDIEFPTMKPTHASLFIDDRGFHFQGTFPSIDYCKEFKPWNKQ